MLEVKFSDGTRIFRPSTALKHAPSELRTIAGMLHDGPYGRVNDLKRLITFEKLKGNYHDIVYSLEAAQIDFLPYQFKPVLKFVNSVAERLIIADEVGLGKTIESALIWIELKARRRARRLLVVCPNILREKWRDELRSKFLLDARVVDFKNLLDEVNQLREAGPEHEFVLISSYTSLRPSRKKLAQLDSHQDVRASSPKEEFLQQVRNWDAGYPPFDLIIFDEAHYMRNPASSTFELGRHLTSHPETAVLCVSATPVNNNTKDLHSLFRLVDQDFAGSHKLFDSLLKANKPTVAAINALSKVPLDFELLTTTAQEMHKNNYIRESPLFNQFLDQLNILRHGSTDNDAISEAQDTAEKLNLFGSYINRTRRVQIQENRPVRQSTVLSVEFTSEEMTLYKTILSFVREKCQKNNREFYVFGVLSLQLRAASCLPVVAAEILEEDSFDPDPELVAEAVGYETELDTFTAITTDKIKALVRNYDFESNDSKFEKLIDFFEKSCGEKVIIFSFYRKTLVYLERRLKSRGIKSVVIHGGVENEERWKRLDQFKNDLSTSVLLSSEVGSEGIDLQFCRTLVNYDLPWNPMRVEQRIGRIDRVGQNATKLSIVNFKVEGTIEERLYKKLHEKLQLYASSLGDLDAVIGDEVKQLTVDLLSRELTPEQEAIRISQTEAALSNQLRDMKHLEDSGDSLLALSDYVQSKIKQKREFGRYIQPVELEDYVSDFFEREFPRTRIEYNTPGGGAMRIMLPFEAHSSLQNFVRDDRSLSARPFRSPSFSITFRKEVFDVLRSEGFSDVHFTNHLSPLIRWITHHNTSSPHTIYNVSALVLRSASRKPGDYVYLVDRWSYKGQANREYMSFGVIPVGEGPPLSADESEKVVNEMLRAATTWSRPLIDASMVGRAYKTLRAGLDNRFDKSLKAFEYENDTAVQISAERTGQHFQRKIAASIAAIETMKEKNLPAYLITGRETRLKNEKEDRERKMSEILRKKSFDFECQEIAGGIFRVIGEDGSV